MENTISHEIKYFALHHSLSFSNFFSYYLCFFINHVILDLFNYMDKIFNFYL